ncbi:MAG: LysM peptidoglycan-binding domain-containing protein [Gemmatimonadetes bacterium]|nr:LysM peptidoglycan-binding domain-containing protein [Gemmatimonadota bacterium]
MRRALLVVVALTGAGCARAAVESRPASSPAITPEQTPVAAPAAIPVTPVTTPAAIARRDLTVARDSAADAAALDSLQVAVPDSLPELNLDTPTFDLNVAAYAEHPRVQYYVDYFSGRGRERFQIWLDRMPRYETLARDRLSERGLPGDLVYLALIESGFSSSAVSRAKAVGMWQFMPATGKGYGLRIDGWVDERRDPIKATDAAARHLRDLTERFGSYYLAAAAYNAGAGKVGRSLDRMGATMGQGDEPLDLSSDDAFFSLADTRLIVQETRDYVPKLIAAALIAKSPTRYGFEAPDPIEPFPLDSVVLSGGTGLDLVARLADVSLESMRELNPHLLRLVTPPGESYAVRVPAGTAEIVRARYADVPLAERSAVATHKVKAGETVATVAKKYGVTAALVRSANRLSTRARVKSGSTLFIPVSRTLPASVFRAPEPIVTAAATTRTHIVRKGETLSGIAARYGVSVSSLRSTNRLSSKATIRSGQKLLVRRSGGTAAPAARRSTATTTRSAAPAARATSRTHVVKSGETIGGIASRYGVGQSALLRVNGLSQRSTIKVGQKIRVP